MPGEGQAVCTSPTRTPGRSLQTVRIPFGGGFSAARGLAGSACVFLSPAQETGPSPPLGRPHQSAPFCGAAHVPLGALTVAAAGWRQPPQERGASERICPPSCPACSCPALWVS